MTKKVVALLVLVGCLILIVTIQVRAKIARQREEAQRKEQRDADEVKKQMEAARKEWRRGLEEELKELRAAYAEKSGTPNFGAVRPDWSKDDSQLLEEIKQLKERIGPDESK